MRKVSRIVLAMFLIGMIFAPLISMPVQGAVITIVADTYWTSSQNNTDGYIVRGATLYVCANGSIGDIIIVHGTAGVGDLFVEDDGSIVFISGNNSNKIYVGGWDNGVGHANALKCYGNFETDYLGSDNTTTVFIGLGADGNKTTDTNTDIRRQTYQQKIENVQFQSDTTYGIYSTGGYFKNCIFGDKTEQRAIYSNSEGNFWFEDCKLWGTAIAIFHYQGFISHEIGTTDRNGKADASNVYNNKYEYISRFYPEVQESDGTPIENATLVLMDNTTAMSWSCRTNSTGEVNSSSNKFGLDYLLGLYQKSDEVFGTTTISDNSTNSTLIVSAPGYSTNITYWNMTLDQGNQTDPVNITLAAEAGGGGGEWFNISTIFDNSTTSYYDNATAFPQSDFLYNDTVYFNGSMYLTHDLVNVTVISSIYNETHVLQDELINATWNFTANQTVSLWTLNGNATLNWTANMTDGEYYINVSVNKTNEMYNETDQEYFRIDNNPMLDVESVVWNPLGTADSSMYLNESLIFTTAFESDTNITDLWVNISVYDNMGAWYSTLIDNTSINILPDYSHNITDDLNGGATIWLNGTDFELGEYVIICKWNKTNVLNDRWTYSQFSVIYYGHIYVAFDNSTQSYNNTLLDTPTSRFNKLQTVYFNGSFSLSQNLTNVSINATIHNETGTWTATIFNITQNFTQNISVNLTELNANSISNVTGNITEGNYYLQLNITHTSGNLTNVTDITGFDIENLPLTWVNRTIGGGDNSRFAAHFNYDFEPILTVQFFDATTSEGTLIERYSWDFGDDSELDHGENPVHKYSFPGSYNVTLRVRNSLGSMDSYTEQVDIPGPLVTQIYYAWGLFAVLALLTVFEISRERKRTSKKYNALAMWLVLTFFIVMVGISYGWKL